jgi:sucrose-6-phosphate hydrolase SacC (GH32 family)
MSNTFGFSQGNDGTTQIARITVPGCGRNEKNDAPVIMVEVGKEGKITLLVYADILSTEPTHEIPLNGALLTKKRKGSFRRRKGEPMTYALIKVNVDLYAPGAILTPTTIKWLSGWGRFHTRRIIYPVKPLQEMTDETVGEARIALEDFFHIRFSSMDDEYTGVLDSGMDFIWTNTRLDEFFGEDLHRIAGAAMNKSPHYRECRTYAAWMELWEYDDQKKTGKFISEINFLKLVETIKTPG